MNIINYIYIYRYVTFSQVIIKSQSVAMAALDDKTPPAIDLCWDPGRVRIADELFGGPVLGFSVGTTC